MKDDSLIFKALGALLTALCLYWIKSGTDINSILFIILLALGIFFLAMPRKK